MLDPTSGGCSSNLRAMVSVIGVLDTSGRSSSGSFGVSHVVGSGEVRTVAGSAVGVRSNRCHAVEWSWAPIECGDDVSISLDRPVVCPWDCVCSSCGVLVIATSAPPVTHVSLGTAVGVCSPESSALGTDHCIVTSGGVVAMTVHMVSGGPSVAIRIEVT